MVETRDRIDDLLPLRSAAENGGEALCGKAFQSGREIGFPFQFPM
jgi:hypothetical protein